MTFLTPIAAIVAASIVLPLLLLLYFLKLRRAPRRIASTLLWQRAVRDLQVNAPFQRIRLSLLLLLQLLIVTLLILALGGPVIESAAPESTRNILLIDRSASMNATDMGERYRTRLDAAKEAAIEIVRRLEEAGGGRAAMIIAFGARAQVIHAFDSNASRLERAINSIEPTDEPADFQAALELAEAFASSGDEESGSLPAVSLISDGAVADRGRGFNVRAGEFRFVRIGSESEMGVANRGLATFEARRAFDDAGLVEIFVRAVNADPAPFRSTITLRADERVVRTESVEIPPATADRPGEMPLAMSFRLERGAVITASLTAGDALATDNIAAVVMPPPTKPRVLVVSAGGVIDPYVEGVLAAFEPESVRIVNNESVEANSITDVTLAEQFDLVVFDGVRPRGYPVLPSLTFGAAPPDAEPRDPQSPGGQRVLSWNRQHPLLRNVELDDLVFSEPVLFDVPENAMALAQGREAPVVTLVRRNDHPHVFIAFTLARSNWPILPSILVFTQNLLDRAGLGATGQTGRSIRPGEPITVRPLPNADRITVRGSDGFERTMPVRPDDSVITLPPFARVGLYTVEGVFPTDARIAVTLSSELESDIRPRDSVRVNAQEVAGGDVDRVAARELWPWFVLAALGLFVVEWLIYTMQARVT